MRYQVNDEGNIALPPAGAAMDDADDPAEDNILQVRITGLGYSKLPITLNPRLSVSVSLYLWLQCISRAAQQFGLSDKSYSRR